MNASIEFKDCNIVIVANNFNVSIVNTVWLFKNAVFTEEELQSSTSLPIMVEVLTDSFKLHLVPDRLQFSVIPTFENKQDLILSKIGKLVETLPHTPFVAAGLNFTYHVVPDTKDIGSLTRSLFCNTQSRLFDDLDSDDVRFGGYFSKDLLDMRYRLDAKPVTINSSKSAQEVLQFSHNFNINLSPGDDYNMILDVIKKWDKAKTITQEITNKVNL